MFSNKLKRMVEVLIILLLIIAAGVSGIFLGYNYVTSQNKRFENLASSLSAGTLVINKDTPGAVMIYIESGDDTSAIADKLKGNGLIDNTLVFTLMSKFNGFDGGYLAGTHFVTKDLSYDELMYMLCQEPEVVKITFPEGMTYQQIKQKLLDSGLKFDPDELDMYMNSPNYFVDYKFVSQIAPTDGRDFVLSGYLYPDTYNFDINAKPQEIIETFLDNMNSKLYQYEDVYARAEKIGMSIDQVMTLASIIQMESSKATDMLTISTVFHNRLESTDPSLQKLDSCATINYLREMDGLDKVWAASSSDMLRDSKYNTYLYAGLPPGPISMPGIDAITAALYPTDENYMYFCSTGDGGTAFAMTADEQAANVAKYSEFWNDTVTSTPSPADESALANEAG